MVEDELEDGTSADEDATEGEEYGEASEEDAECDTELDESYEAYRAALHEGAGEEEA